MSSPSDPGRVARFGVFEVDLDACELRKNGLRIKLQSQPFRVLAHLLKHPGENVKRKQLCDVLWPDGTVVEFEHSLNTAVKKLRAALGDSAENPRFVSTISGIGYRFIAAIEPAAEAAPPRPPPSPVRKQMIWLASLIAGLAVAAALMWRYSTPVTSSPSPPKVVSLTTFPGVEKDPAFSPDGKQVAFGWQKEGKADADIYVMLIGEGDPLRLTSNPNEEENPVFSPDGRRIAFLRRYESPSRFGVFVIPALGGAERLVAEVAEMAALPPPYLAWTPDGRWLIVPDRSSSSQAYSLYLSSVDAGERRRLTHPPPSFGDGSAALSPDGRTLAFIRRSALLAGDVYILDLTHEFSAQGEPRRVTHWNCTSRDIMWSPDGLEMLFVAAPEGAPGLWRLDASGPPASSADQRCRSLRVETKLIPPGRPAGIFRSSFRP